MRTTRGMSPLLATILLIAFAVSLGILIMSLGQKMGGHEGSSINMSRVCERTEFNIVNISGHSSLCYDRDAGKVHFMGINRGEQTIDSMQMWIVGNNLHKTEALEEPLEPMSSVEQQVEYDYSRYGSIRKVQFIPRVKRGHLSDAYLCIDFPIVVDEVRKC